jgi:8-oxo-dGTP pyrophosphatase MutT (NUDIX family)
MSAPRLWATRLCYRTAYRLLQLVGMISGHHGHGVKCLLTHRGQILLVRHTYGQRQVWYLPGGGVRRSEQPLAAGLREMQEELGIEIPTMRELGRIELQLDHMSAIITCLHAELTDPRLHPNPGEIAQAAWFEPDALPSPLGSEVRRLGALLEHDSGGAARRAIP